MSMNETESINISKDTAQRAEEIAQFTELLYSDFIMASKSLLEESESEYLRRNLVRTAGSYIDGTINYYKSQLLDMHSKHSILTKDQHACLSEVRLFIDQNGDIIRSNLYFPFENTMFFVIRLIPKMLKCRVPLNIYKNCDGYKKFKKFINLRNSVTHPKTIKSLSVTDGDIELVAKGINWFKFQTNYAMAFGWHCVWELIRVNREMREAISKFDRGGYKTPESIQQYEKNLLKQKEEFQPFILNTIKMGLDVGITEEMIEKDMERAARIFRKGVNAIDGAKH